MPKNTKGTRRERELVSRLHDDGWTVMRAPASGSATDRELPDVLAGNGKRFFAIEAKASKDRPIYVGKDEISALEYFSEGFGATPLVGARFDREDWYFFHPSELHDSGKNLRVKKQTAIEDGMTMTELVSAPGLGGNHAHLDREEYAAVVERLYPYDDTVTGGVPRSAVMDVLGRSKTAVNRALKELVGDGRLERLDGVHGPTYAPKGVGGDE